MSGEEVEPKPRVGHAGPPGGLGGIAVGPRGPDMNTGGSVAEDDDGTVPRGLCWLGRIL